MTNNGIIDMPAKDKIHNAVKNALIKEGWTITADPYTIQYDGQILFADMAAERPIAAKLSGRTIVVEAKTFISHSFIKDLEKAVGQYLIYLALLELTVPERQLYLAISDWTYQNFCQRKAVSIIIKRYQIALLIIDINTEEILEWKT
jgi:hypothetical protein